MADVNDNNRNVNNDLISLLNILISLSIFFVFTLSCPFIYKSEQPDLIYLYRNYNHSKETK